MDRLSAALISTFTVSLLHTLIPSHWLCFVVVGRAQGWRLRKTLGVAAAAGLLHVASTMVLGVLFALTGRTLLGGDDHLLEMASAGVLGGLGLLYLVSHALHAGHHHEQDQRVTEQAAFVALLFSLVFSPCTLSIPLLFATAWSAGWIALSLVAVVLLVSTVGVMLLLVGLTSLGIEKLQFSILERYEKLIVGIVLCLLGATVLLLHASHA